MSVDRAYFRIRLAVLLAVGRGIAIASAVVFVCNLS
jgi:hypothetical protein